MSLNGGTMRGVLLLVVCEFTCGLGNLWGKGIVHYAINTKDYDVHSQDEILSALAEIQKEVCVKFFHISTNYTASDGKVLHISNPSRRKDCPPDHYDYSRDVIDMPIGYRCLNPKDISRIVVAMLRASIEQTIPTINSYDLMKKFRERDADFPRPGLLSPSDRNYINAYYHLECGVLAEHASRRVSTAESVDAGVLKYFEKSLWPLGVVMYGVAGDIEPSEQNLKIVHHAMATIELASCVVFQRVTDLDVLAPKNLLWLSDEGEDMPHLGFKEGNQTLNLSSMARGAPGHSGHPLNMLLRVLGVPMMSNRYDRNNYVTINWGRVQPGKEQYLEKMPQEAWLTSIPYDFSSVTHAPANYLCRNCDSATEYQTVSPVQDHLWQRTLSMGRRVDLSDSDKQILATLYRNKCQDRFATKQ